ncbi:uncharacterized protein LOC119323880 [Triticum dicoccoides]|uniref:uncharacterized protein LOC119323880 n=1 Tax=Triticum dicoccoides TaxID=85692 RepID=UPI001891D8C4|nr:uncharacterized protein LOC119323880 [Triticum dicoccoides]
MALCRQATSCEDLATALYGFSGVLTIAGFINQNMCRGSESSTLPHGWTRQRCVEDPHTLHRHLLRLNFLDNTWPQAPSIADCPQILQRKTEELVMATKRLKYLHEAKTSTRMTLVLDPRAVVKEPFCWHFLSRTRRGIVLEGMLM